EPDDLLRPDGAGEFGFDLVLADARIAAGIELHAAGGQHCALPVDVEPSALVAQLRGHHGRARQLGDEASDVLIVVPFRPLLSAPAVEYPVHRAQAARLVDDEARPMSRIHASSRSALTTVIGWRSPSPRWRSACSV